MSTGLRFWSMVAMLLAATMGLHMFSHGQEVPLTRPLASFPFVLGRWQGYELAIEERIIEAVMVDDYLSRTYQEPEGMPLSLYVGYYKSQRPGQTIHSPKNCLPGAGWQPVSASRVDLTVPDGGRGSVNLYLIEKGLERQLVLYWYQSHGRIIASEYWGKIYMVVDALRLNRTDSALVRVTISARPSEKEAQQRAVAFAEQVLAQLQHWIPR